MGASTEIAWCDHTYNPWWGCQRVSPGCGGPQGVGGCYAETLSKRWGFQIWGPEAPRRLFGEKHWREPLKWDDDARRAGTRARVFCASMADVFENRRDLDREREKLWDLIAKTKHLDWLLLTKRPEHMLALAPDDWSESWPENVWAGCTAEDQEHADLRIPLLLQVPAVVHFVSAEPLLGPLDLTRYLPSPPFVLANPPEPIARRLAQVIVGGESGAGARPFDFSWALALLSQCRNSRVAFFMKQMGRVPVIPLVTPWETETSRETLARENAYVHMWPLGTRFGNPVRARTDLNGRVVLLKDPKGGNMAEWPETLRVREFPHPREAP